MEKSFTQLPIERWEEDITVDQAIVYAYPAPPGIEPEPEPPDLLDRAKDQPCCDTPLMTFTPSSSYIKSRLRQFRNR